MLPGSFSSAWQWSSRRSSEPSANRRCRRQPPRSATFFPATPSMVRLASLTGSFPSARRSSTTRRRLWPTSIRACSGPSDELRGMQRGTASSSRSSVDGVHPSTRNSCSVRRSRNMDRRRKLHVGSPLRPRRLTCPGTQSTSVSSMPRRGCPSTASSTGCARATATNLGTTSCASKPPAVVVLACMPTRRTIRGCSSDLLMPAYPIPASAPSTPPVWTRPRAGHAHEGTAAKHVGIGAPDRIRTCDLRLRRPTLYPLSYRREARMIAAERA